MGIEAGSTSRRCQREINHLYDGRGASFDDPDGHRTEPITQHCGDTVFHFDPPRR